MNEIDELKEIIQEAWNAGDRQVKDTFGSFLDRAANKIHSQGYRKIEGEPPASIGGPPSTRTDNSGYLNMLAHKHSGKDCKA